MLEFIEGIIVCYEQFLVIELVLVDVEFGWEKVEIIVVLIWWMLKYKGLEQVVVSVYFMFDEVICGVSFVLI